MALRNVTGSGGRSFALGLQEEVGMPVTYRGPTTTSTAATVSLASAADVESAGDVTLTTATYAGFGTINITVSGTAAGSITISGQTTNGMQSETLSFTSTDRAETTTNNFLSTTANPISLTTTAFGSGITADIEVDTIAGTLRGMGQRYYPCSSVDLREVVTNVESNLRNSSGADTADIQGQYSAAFDVTTGLLIDTTPNFMVGILNHIPTNTAVAAATIDTINIVNANDVLDITPMTAGSVLHPSKLKLTFSTAPGSGAIEITGYIKAGTKEANANTRFQKETITFNGTDTDYESQYYYVVENPRYPVAATVSTAPTTPVMTSAASWDPDLTQADTGIQATDLPFDRWTVETLVDSVPTRGVDIIPNVATVALTETSSDLTLQCLGTEAIQFRTVDSGEQEVITIADADRYADASSVRTPPFLTVFSYGDITVPSTNITLTFNRNYEPDTAFDGDKNQTSIYAGNVRQITISATTRWQVGDPTDMFARWQEIYRNNSRTPLSLRCYYYDEFGHRSQIQFTFPSSQLTESPSFPATADGPIDITLNFKSLVTATNRSEYNVRYFTRNGYVE